MAKWISERCVCDPHKRCAGTAMGPKLSDSMRVSVIVQLLVCDGDHASPTGARAANGPIANAPLLPLLYKSLPRSAGCRGLGPIIPGYPPAHSAFFDRRETMTSTIRDQDLVESVAASLQYISYYHPADYIQHLARAYEREQSAAAKDAMAQILTNSKMAAFGHRPICQDTGIVNVFLKVGMDVKWEGFTMGLEDAINEGVRRGYNHPDNTLRASVVDDPHFARKNTKDNTPAVINVQIVPGDKLDVTVAAKGGGSENKSKMVMMNPSDSLVDWVLKTVPTMGAGWCPPGMLGIGIGGTAQKAVLLAKESQMEDLDMYELKAKAAQGEKLDQVEKLRLELYEKVNALGIGAQGLGGLATVLDIKIKMYPTHAASKPVAMIPNCAATRHAHFVMAGSGPVFLEAPSLEDWPKLTYDASKGTRVDLDT